MQIRIVCSRLAILDLIGRFGVYLGVKNSLSNKQCVESVVAENLHRQEWPALQINPQITNADLKEISIIISPDSPHVSLNSDQIREMSHSNVVRFPIEKRKRRIGERE